jgi:hypothetical protein
MSTESSPKALFRPADPPETRIDPFNDADFPYRPGQYPRWIGHKFSSEGCALHYPGNTVLVHLPAASPFRKRLQDLHNILENHELASAFALLPPSSWHMTVYEGVTDRIRLRQSWPSNLALDSSLAVCHANFANQLAEFEHRLGPKGVGEMEVVGFEPIEDGIGLTLRATGGQEGPLRDLRDRLAARLGMHHPSHDIYTW